jgi:starch phosphorylase
MNEDRSALITLALEDNPAPGSARAFSKEVEAVQRRCVLRRTRRCRRPRLFRAAWYQVLGEARAAALSQMRVMNGELNMTELALRLSGFVNGVSMRHGEVSRDLFPGYNVGAITNGVHAAACTSAPFCALFDRALPEWRRDNCYLRYAIGIPIAEIRQAHTQAKKDLLQQIKWLTGTQLDEKVSPGLASRHKLQWADLLFTDQRLKEIARSVGPFQLVYAGKAHPRDEAGKAIIRRIFEAAAVLAHDVRVVYLENYDMALGKLICSGVDIWLNTPLRPQEASGTSGMKAALNGVPSLSVLDGWWIEGHIEGATGWSIGDGRGTENDSAAEALSLYEKLEQVILPLFYNAPDGYVKVMRSAIAMNGSFFNTQRMISQYVRNAYRLESGNGAKPLP